MPAPCNKQQNPWFIFCFLVFIVFLNQGVVFSKKSTHFLRECFPLKVKEQKWRKTQFYPWFWRFQPCEIIETPHLTCWCFGGFLIETTHLDFIRNKITEIETYSMWNNRIRIPILFKQNERFLYFVSIFFYRDWFSLFLLDFEFLCIEIKGILKSEIHRVSKDFLRAWVFNFGIIELIVHFHLSFLCLQLLFILPWPNFRMNWVVYRGFLSTVLGSRIVSGIHLSGLSCFLLLFWRFFPAPLAPLPGLPSLDL